MSEKKPCPVHPHATGGEVKTIGLFPVEGETEAQTYTRWALMLGGEHCVCEGEVGERCHRCCKRPATHEAVLRRATWSKLCDECLTLDLDPASFVPPDGRRIH